jgi:heme/copper-type cytochrome/quinol oxidase subunit 1
MDHGFHGDICDRWYDGVLLAVPPADFVLHNSLFLIAHFHNVIIGGVVSACLRRLTTVP